MKKVGLLSQVIYAAACISFGKNVSAKSVHLTSLYPMVLTSTNDDFTVYVTMFVCQFDPKCQLEGVAPPPTNYF